MGHAHGKFIWYDLITEDADAAADFYGKVLGLSFKPSGMDGYQLIDAPGGTEVGGLMAMDDDMKAGGARPCWLGYVGVEDVDATVEKAKAGGASIHIEPRDIPGVGRFAFFADPSGAMLYVMRGDEDDASRAFSHERVPGHVGWNELAGGDIEKDFAFYEKLFGWTKGEAMDSPQGPYQMFETDGRTIGGMMKAQDPMPPFWFYYIWQDSVEATAERVKANGGSIMVGPEEIPGGDVIIYATDPQGAIFCCVGPR